MMKNTQNNMPHKKALTFNCRKRLIWTAVLIISAFLFCAESVWGNPFFDYTGGFEGAGILVESSSQGFQVRGVFKNSPALGKVKIGDIVTAIDGNRVQGMNERDFFRLVNKKAGEKVSLHLLREGLPLQIEFTSAFIEITPHSIPDSSIPEGGIRGIETPARAVSSLNKFDKIRNGDVFFVFLEDKHMGYARVQQVYDSQSYLNFFELRSPLNHSDISKYRLIYWGYSPAGRAFSQRKTSVDPPDLDGSSSAIDKDKEESSQDTSSEETPLQKPDVRIEGYELFISPAQRLKAKITVKNYGAAPARNTAVTCRFIGGGKYDLGQETRTFRTLPPGGKAVEQFSSSLVWKAGQHYWRFSDDRKTLTIYRGSSPASTIIYKVVCEAVVE